MDFCTCLFEFLTLICLCCSCGQEEEEKEEEEEEEAADLGVKGMTNERRTGPRRLELGSWIMQLPLQWSAWPLPAE